MAQEAGIRYYGATVDNYGQCLTTASSACLSATGNTFGNYGCYNTGNKRDPFPCLIGEVDPCPVNTSSVAVDWSINSLEVSTVAYLFTGSLLMWVVGLGIGLLIAQVRKTRIR